jgi:hypothetical protein
MWWKPSGLDVDFQTGRRPAGWHDVLRWRIGQFARWSEVAILRPRCESSAFASAQVKGVRWMAAGPHGYGVKSGAAARDAHGFCREARRFSFGGAPVDGFRLSACGS